MDTEIAGSSGYTDHFPTFIVLKAKAARRPKNESYVKYFFNQKGHKKRRERIAEENWDDVYEQDDPNIIYDLIQEKYGKHYHESKIEKIYKTGSNRFRREPWMTSELLADMRRRDRLAKIKDRRPDCKKLRNEIVAKSRKAQKEHVDKQIRESMGDIKKHWAVVRQVTNKTNNKEETTTGFYHLGDWIENDKENVEKMNEFLANIGRETNENVGNVTKLNTTSLDTPRPIKIPSY